MTFLVATIRRCSLCALALLVVPLAVSCHQPPPAEMKAHVELDPSEADDPATGGERVLRIGLLPERDIFHQLERYETLAGYLSEKTGTRVRLQMVPAYSRIVEGFEVAGLDGAFLGSLAYVVAHRRLGVTVLARPEQLDGSSTYRGLIFARGDRGIHGVEQMRDLRFVFVDRTTTAGFLLPLHYFRRHGLDDYTTWFAESYFAGTHEDAILDVLNGAADVGAAKSTIFERLATEQPRVHEELRVLETSPDVPSNALAVRHDLEPALQGALRSALLEMHENPGGSAVLRQMGWRRFVSTTDDDYGVLYRYAEEVGNPAPLSATSVTQ